MKRKPNNSVGLKYYKYNGDQLEVIRIFKYYNPNKIMVLCEDNTCKILNREQLDEYVKLNSDGLMIFNIVKISNSQDVLISLHRRKDITEKKIFPYLVCRQNVKDIFDYSIQGDWSKTSIGVCVTTDTIPQGIDFKSLFKVDSVIETQMVNIYIDDTLDSILKFIKKYYLNECLIKLNAEIKKYPHLVSTGSCTSVEELLNTNDFMLDFDRGYNIIRLEKIDLTKNLKDRTLDDEAIKELTAQTNILVLPQNTFIVEYDKTIDLTKIEEKYFLIRDKNNKLYVVLYKDDSIVLPSFKQETADILDHFKLKNKHIL